MPDFTTVTDLRRAIPVASGTQGQRVLLRPTYTKTRITFTGRSTGTVVILVKSYVRADDNKLLLLADLPIGDFENVVNGTIDLAQRKTITLNGEFTAISVSDNGGTGDFKMDVHQLA